MIDPENVARFIELSDDGTPVDLTKIYTDLITEEYRELLEAISTKTDEEILNESMDLVWVVIGFCLTKRYDIPGAWQELTRANLSKLQFDPVTGKLLRKPNGKIMKPKGWKAPEFGPYVRESKV